MKPAAKDAGPYRPLDYFQLMEVSLRELLVERGVITEDAIAGAMATMRARGPERGAAMVARAWLDPAYKARMLANGSAAAEELGFEVAGLKLIVVENTPSVSPSFGAALNRKLASLSVPLPGMFWTMMLGLPGICLPR